MSVPTPRRPESSAGTDESKSKTPAPGWARGQPISFPLPFGRYRLESKIGHGGMGSVYLATDTAENRQVAIKIPSAYLGDNVMVRERFYREARLAAALNHPQICPVFDVGQHEGVFFLAMPYIEGKPLSRFIVPGQKLPARNVATVVRALARAMHEAHTQGVIHRDLKPSNIMIGLNKRPVIMDFGLAKNVDADDGSALTTSGMIMGTPQYMSPEQIDGDNKWITPRSDVYSLGVILYELLAGQRPFEGPLSKLIAQIVTQSPPPLRRFRPDLDAVLELICLKAMAKKPDDRFADMQQFETALTDWLAGRPLDITVPADEESVVVQLIDVMAANVEQRGKISRTNQPEVAFEEVPSVHRMAGAMEEIRSSKHRFHHRGRRGSRPLWVRVLLRTLIPGLLIVAALIGGIKGWELLSPWLYR